MTLAPVAIYTYSRLDHLQKTVDSLKINHLAKQTTLIIVSDGPSVKEHYPIIQKVRDYIDSITGFKEVIKEFRAVNLGSPQSIIEAESRLVNKYGVLISLEDDNVCAPNFLDYMNQALNYFEHDPSIFSVCGYCPPIIAQNEREELKADFFQYHWNLSWGYGIWKDKYNKLMALPNDYQEVEKSGLFNKIFQLGGQYIVDALYRDYKYNADFPDAWLCAKMTHLDHQSIIPTISKVRNIGSDGSGHHRGTLEKKFDVFLDQGTKRDFDFNTRSKDESSYVKRLLKFYNGRLLGRLARMLKIYHHVLKLKY